MFRGSSRFNFLFLVCIFIWCFCTLLRRDRKSFCEIKPEELLKCFDNPLHLANIKIYPEANSYELKDWHDYKFMDYEAHRYGPGENGSAFVLTDPSDVKIGKKLLQIEGLNVLVSDKISVNRSLPDVRHKKFVLAFSRVCFAKKSPSRCRIKFYLKELPQTSCVVIFHNEHPSIIFRALHSIVNRTPHELLREIILVNDASTKLELRETFIEYISKNFHGIVKLVQLEKRVGLIVARMEGARRASGEVLVFLDSHVEVNVNWLPPLLGD
jgi:polypeptide N-acetylgalactosaminyltransferase